MIVSRPNRRGIAGLTVLLLAVSLSSATTLMRVQEFPELVDQSQRGALVQVLAVSYGYDESHLPSTSVLLRVEDPIYGAPLPEAGKTLRIKLFGAPVDMPDGRRLHVDGTPRYQVGERYVLLLLGESEFGFTNTASLGFGVFRVSDDATGQPLAQSVMGNRRAFGENGLASWLDDGEQQAGVSGDPSAPVAYPLLRRALTDLWGVDGGENGGQP
jgi:hypothetical protein